MNFFIRNFVACIAGTLIYSPIVSADAVAAVSALYRNMEKVGVRWLTSEKNTQATPTMVRGVYRATDKSSGSFLGYISENGTIVGDSRGWRVIGRGPMNSNDTAELRKEILRNIDLDKLIKIKYGDGGGRKLLLFSAVDCPFCKKFESNAARFLSRVNTTYYVVPSALRPQNSPIATSIWCAKDNAEAWRTFWASMKPSFSQSCTFGESAAKEMRGQLNDLLSSVGIHLTGVPVFLREDGKMFTPEPNFTENYAISVFGPKALSNIHSVHDETPAKWLSSANLSSPDVSRNGVAAGTDSDSNNLGVALKKIFGQ